MLSRAGSLDLTSRRSGCVSRACLGGSGDRDAAGLRGFALGPAGVSRAAVAAGCAAAAVLCGARAAGGCEPEAGGGKAAVGGCAEAAVAVGGAAGFGAAV